MKKIFLLFLLLIISLTLNQAALAQTPDPNQDAKTQVVIIGTIHSAHYKNPNYSPEKLKKIILSLKPDAILNELPLSLVDPNGRPIKRIRQKGRPGGPESWASYTAAMELGGVPQIPFDRPDRQENFRKTNYFEKEKRARELEKICGQCLLENEPNSINVKIAQLQGYAGLAEGTLVRNADPKVINSEAHDSIIRIKKSLWYEIIPEILQKYPECKELIELDHFFEDQWNARNKMMADNIIKAAKEYPGKRLVVITGATHRYILRDLLKNNPNIELKEYWEVVGTEISNLFLGTLYVDSQKGSDANPGTQEKPLLTISKAAAIVNSKKGAEPTTIKINPGTYNLASSVIFDNPGEYTEKDRLIIEASILPDDPQWKPSLMPVILSTENPGISDKLTETYSLKIRRSYVTIRGLKFLGNPLTNNWHACIERIGKDLDDLLITQCMFIGDKDSFNIYCAAIATGNRFVVDHCIFRNCHASTVYWDGLEGVGSKGCAMKYCIVDRGLISGVWTCQTAEDFEFRNNIITNCDYFWMRKPGDQMTYQLQDCIVTDNKHYSGYGVETGATGQTGLEVTYNENNVVKTEQIVFEKDKSKNSYLHVASGTFGSDLGAGLFVKSTGKSNKSTDSAIESNVILHIMSHKDWSKALDSGEYRPGSLNSEGYIHCSKPSQIIEVANHLFKGQKGLVLLVIDAKKVKPEIKWEGKEQANLYPHIYGSLNLDAVRNVLDFLPLEDGTFKLPEQIQKDKDIDIKKYYANHGDITNTGKYINMYEGLPAEVNQICKIVQGSLVHVFHAHRYGAKLTEEQKGDVQLRSVEDMLERTHKSDERPIRFAREPGKRLVGNCRHFAVLLCSMLRHKNIPARARCGFASYFPLSHKYDDHWICEYWNESQARWVQVDAQLDSVQLEQMRIDINPLDLPKGAFLPAGTAWQMCKAGKEDPNRFGFADMKGMWFISGNVVRDFMALNKVELLPWDNMDLMIGPKEKSTSEKEAMINRLAELSNSPDDNFEQIRSLYKKDIRF